MRRLGRSLATATSLIVLIQGVQCADQPTDTPSAHSRGAATARFPYGVYAYFTFPSLTDDTGAYPLSSFRGDLSTAVADSAISGLAIEVGWDQLNPNPPAGDVMEAGDAGPAVAFCDDTAPPAANQPYDWRIYDAAFCQVESWNAGHPHDVPKTIELMVAPGFNTPGWALDRIPGSCDALFDGTTPHDAPCGQATFLNSEATTRPTLQPLPLPWDPTYQSLWRSFLTTLNHRYGGEAPFVAIGVAGPTAKTYEIILPEGPIPSGAREADGTAPAYSLPRSQTTMWETLLRSRSSNPTGFSEALSDQRFIDAWDAAIDMYDAIFARVTLIVSTGNQLPNFPGGPFAPAGAPGGPAASLDFSPDCVAANGNMDCAAETAIEAHLLALETKNDNLKATMTSGMSRARWNDYLGLGGVKLLSAAYPGQVLGGAELNTEFSKRPVAEGCPVPVPPPSSDVYSPAHCTPTMLAACTSDDCDLAVPCIPAACVVRTIPSSQFGVGMYELTPEPPKSGEVQYVISPEQALYNVLQNYFNGTAAAPSYGAAIYRDRGYAETTGSAQLNYLLVYYEDVGYAVHGVSDAGPVAAKIVPADGGTMTTSAQEELDTASQQIGQTADPVPPEPAP